MAAVGSLHSGPGNHAALGPQEGETCQDRSEDERSSMAVRTSYRHGKGTFFLLRLIVRIGGD